MLSPATRTLRFIFENENGVEDGTTIWTVGGIRDPACCFLDHFGAINGILGRITRKVTIPRIILLLRRRRQLLPFKSSWKRSWNG
jgi:hypothetical protein